MGCPLKYLYVQSVQRPLEVVCLTRPPCQAGCLFLPSLHSLARSLPARLILLSSRGAQ